jgi:DNA-binding NtrC family response regulator
MKILVVEDNEKHLQDAINSLGMINGLELLTAKCVADATKIIYKEKPDGVITDIFLPYRTGDHADNPLGLLVAANAVSHEVNSVFCTNLFHHSEKMEWINQIFNDLRKPLKFQWGDYIIDNSPDKENQKKDWLGAYKHLTEIDQLRVIHF